ncbi:MAG: caspase family protein [Armatimonadetes bacterium]|nr:caspase family protein [Armatimonadota bacterium]
MAAAIIAGLSAASFAETYAVCIGINQYGSSKDADGHEVDHNLRGAVNDANSMRDILVKHYGAHEGNIKMLRDKDADADNVVDGIRWLIKTAKPGDQVVFAFSGHGGRLEDKDEPDGHESVIVLADGKLLPGKLMGEFAKMEAANGVHATIVLDSCFSGGMSRPGGEMFQPRLKSYGDIKVGPRSKKVDLTKASMANLVLRTKGDEAPKGSYAFYYAGKADQPTIDLPQLGDTPPHGLFTTLLMSVIEDNPKTPMTDMFEAINATIAALNKQIKEKRPDFEGFKQAPDFEASTEARAKQPLVVGS